MPLMEISFKFFHYIAECHAIGLSTPVMIIFRIESISFYNLLFHRQMDFTVQRNRYLSTKTNFVPRIHSDVFYFCIFASVRVSQTSKAMQTTAIGTVANSLPENEIILLTLLISKRYISYTELQKNPVIQACLYSFFAPRGRGRRAMRHAVGTLCGHGQRTQFLLMKSSNSAR